jgi:hypothetical protein
MSCACPDDSALPGVPEGTGQGRSACLALLDAVLGHPPGGIRGTALFLLDCCGPQLGDAALAEVERRLRAAAPAWHRLLRGDKGEFVVIAQGLVDGGAVLTAAARLVHAFDDALQTADLPLCPDVAIGISFATQHTARAAAMLAAAESGLRESRAATRLGRRGMPPSIPPLD